MRIAEEGKLSKFWFWGIDGILTKNEGKGYNK